MPTLLVLTVLLPLVGGVVLFCLPKLDYRQARWAALAVSLATFVLSLILAVGFQTDVSGPQFTIAGSATSESQTEAVYGWQWVDVGYGSGIRFALGLDGISLVLTVLTTLLVVSSIFSSWEPIRDRAPAHYALILWLEAGMIGVFAALDVVLFYLFFEFTLLPLFFLIGIYGGPDRRRASITFFLYTLAGSLLTLLGVIALVVIHYQFRGWLTFSIPGLIEGLRALPWDRWGELAPYLTDPAANPIPQAWLSPQALIFLLLFAGFAVKVPIFPFHTWLPLAHVEASTAGSILLAGVLLKVGAYGFLRFNLAMTPLGSELFMPMMMVLGVIGIIYGALTSLAQTDVKRLVAYSSVSHMGFIMLGMYSLTTIGLDGSVMQMLNHGITTGALFACVGVFYERYHTREVSEIGGLWKRLPVLAFFFILSALGASAVPGLNGFVGEFPILLGTFQREPVYAILGTIGMILGPYYLLLMVQRVVFGPLREPLPLEEPASPEAEPETPAQPPTVRSIGWHEVAGLTPLMVLIVAIGVYPKPIFDRIRPPLREIASGLPSANTAPAVPVVWQDPGDDSQNESNPRPSSAILTQKTSQDRAR